MPRSTSHRASRARRRALAAVAAAGSVLASRLAWAVDERFTPTPALTEGPFYPESFPDAPRAQLIVGRLAAGEPLALAGTVRDPSGRLLTGVRVELWQCDGLGHYRHSRDRALEGDARSGARGASDPAFLGYGWMRTDAAGRYAFETIRPVPYPGRTPHIHLSAIAPDGRRLVTQMFVAGDPGNARDVLWRWLAPAARQLVTVPVLAAPAGGWAARFDLVLRA